MLPPPLRTHRPLVAGVVAAAAVAGYARAKARRPRWAPPAGREVQTPFLHVRLLGDGGPTVVLLHGLVGSGLFWGAAYDGLAAGHRLVVPDLLGFGRSPRPANGYGPDDHAGAVARCLDELGITGPVTIGAHSLGTLVALRLALMNPALVRSIVAFGPPIYADAAGARAHVNATGPMGRLSSLPWGADAWACRLVCDHRALAARVAVASHPGLPPAIAADAVEHSWASYSETLDRVILAAEATSWLDRVHCPVRLVAGDDDPVVDHAHLRRLAAAHATVELVERPGRHDLPLAEAGACQAMIATATATADRA